MAVYPKIDSPCPYADRLAEVVQGGFCRMCKRDVHDLSGMDDAARLAFVDACGVQETCISYRIPRSLAAAVIAASAVAAMPAAAQEVSPPAQTVSAPQPAPQPEPEDEEMIVVTGGRMAMPIMTVTEPVEVVTPAQIDRDRRRRGRDRDSN